MNIYFDISIIIINLYYICGARTRAVGCATWGISGMNNIHLHVVSQKSECSEDVTRRSWAIEYALQ